MSTHVELDDRKTRIGPDNHRALEHDVQLDARGDSTGSPTGSESSRRSTHTISLSRQLTYTENSRDYCSATYPYPCDADEATRLTILHQAYLPILDGALTLVAIPRHASRILDIGTGTADWAVAVAERFPNAQVVATDITTALQPEQGPPNLEYELDDANGVWTFGGEPFDFIHMRGLMGAFEDWQTVYAEAAKHLSLGGILAVADFSLIQSDHAGPSTSALTEYNEALRSAAAKARTPMDLRHLEGDFFDKVGLNVVKRKIAWVTVGQKESEERKRAAGKMATVAALEGLEAGGLRLLTKYGGMTEKEVRRLCERVKADCLASGSDAKVGVYFVVARRLI